MELIQRFKAVTATRFISISALQQENSYRFIKATRVQTRYGESVTLTLDGSDDNMYNIFIPKRNVNVFTDSDLQNINEGQTSILLVYKGKCNKAFVISMETDETQYEASLPLSKMCFI
jgi:hypothetical protein